MKTTNYLKCYCNSYNCTTDENADIARLFYSVIPVFGLLLKQLCDKMNVITKQIRRDCEHTW